MKIYYPECGQTVEQAAAAAKAKAAEEHRVREQLLSTAPATMTLRDPDAWEECKRVNSDGYGGAVISYAERWARIMEGELSKGATLPDCADHLSHVADEEGITGFMYGCAVSILSQVWIHGEHLRRWHNKSTQLGTEGDAANESGGVLNPAIITIGG